MDAYNFYWKIKTLWSKRCEAQFKTNAKPSITYVLVVVGNETRRVIDAELVGDSIVLKLEDKHEEDN